MKKTKFIFFSIAFIYITAFAVLSVWNKLTYLEYSDINQSPDSAIVIASNQQALIQDFVMPFDFIQSLSVRIGTFGRNNNSEWRVELFSPDTHRIYYSGHFNATRAPEGYYNVAFGKNIRLTKNARYQVRISANSVNSDNALAFYVSKGVRDNLSLSFGGKSYDGTLCIRIFGGDVDYWWAGFVIFLSVIAFLLVLRIRYITETMKIKWYQDIYVQGSIVGIISFLLLFTFYNADKYIDESDNLIGAMVIAHGGVLYRDYMTSHPPFVYYLCSIFALFGAKSVAQFRLLYYFVESIIWGMLYIRHKPQFGRKMMLLPLLECVITNSMLFNNYAPQAGCLILSDGVQSLCFVALLLELFKFWNDRTLKWDRAVIVSACIWASMGSAFLSAYVLIWIVLAFLVLEFKYWNEKEISLRGCFNRYGKLLIAVSVPLILAVIYFSLNHSLGTTVEQFYSFNREINSIYSGGMGNNIAGPFISAVQTFFRFITNFLNAIITGHATTTIVLHSFLLVTSVSIFVCMLRERQYLKPFVLFTVICFAGVRGFDFFHSLAAWYVAVMVIVLFYDELFSYLPKICVPILTVIFVYCTSIFVQAVCTNLVRTQESISELDHYIILNTEDGEKLVVDSGGASGSSDNLYILYKNRHTVNSVKYMFPGYMDWYEDRTVDELLKNRPRHVVYGYNDFANRFYRILNERYKRISYNQGDGWKYFIWEINELKQ